MHLSSSCPRSWRSPPPFPRRRRFPSRAIIKASTTFVNKGIEEGLKAEEEESKICSPSKDAIEGFTAFMEKRNPSSRANKNSFLEENMDVKKIAVIGAGAMGNGIAQVGLMAGYTVPCTTWSSASWTGA